MMKTATLTLIAVALAMMLMASSCGKKEAETEEVIRPVRYAEVYATGGSRERTFSGTVQAGLESSLSFKVPGTVVEISVKIGDRVRQGSVMAELDDSDYRLQLQEAQAALAQAQAQQRNARSGYDRVQALYENRNASKQDLDGARAAFESASAQVESIEKRLELAKLQVSYTLLKAPYDGAVADVRVDVNENVGAGTPVVVLTSGEAPEVTVSVPEVLIAQVRPGSPATVSCDAFPGENMKAKVTEVGVTSTAFATTFPVTVRLESAREGVRPGMAAEVSFRFETAGTQERMIVPAVAVGEDRLGRFVFTIELAGEGLGVARRRPVQVGELTSEGLEILDGVEEGDLVITAGVSRIAEGQKVRLF
jgi:RND family efflux transporter MFP subunit